MVLELPLQLPQFALTVAARHPKFGRNRDGMAQPIVGISSLTRLAPRFTRPFNASESAFGTSDLRDCPAAFRARVRDDSPFSRIALASAPLHEFRLEVRRQLRDIDPHCFPFLPQNGVRYRHDGERERRMD